jgi:hypothetical protein
VSRPSLTLENPQSASPVAQPRLAAILMHHHRNIGIASTAASGGEKNAHFIICVRFPALALHNHSAIVGSSVRGLHNGLYLFQIVDTLKAVGHSRFQQHARAIGAWIRGRHKSPKQSINNSKLYQRRRINQLKIENSFHFTQALLVIFA